MAAGRDGLDLPSVKLTNDIETLRAWVGKTRSDTDQFMAQPAEFLAKTLDIDWSPIAGERLFPLWHYLYFLTAEPLSELGRDGHAARGEALPPIALPRRMWAGGRFTFHGDLHIGDVVERTSTITSVDQKDGRTGPLIFVTSEFKYTVDGELVLTEEKDLVYREDPTADSTRAISPRRAREPQGWSTTVTPGPVMLFRYSALTFNNHRIHYDRAYARDVENYPGLVVHGPLTATLLSGLAEERTGKRLKTFSFRASAPLFDTPFEIDGRETTDGAEVWASTPDGNLAMAADATFF